MSIERVGVVGGGQMGGGIAEVCAKSGVDVVVFEPTTELAATALDRLTRSLDRAVERGKLDDDARSAALARLDVTADMGAMADRQLVIEAVTENEDLKKQIFGTLDEVVTDSGAILASNTSSIPITRIAMATSRPASVVGMHFFNPPVVMKLVEIVRSPLSSDDAIDRAAGFAADTLGKVVVHAKDRSGFIVNMLLVPYIIDAIRMYEEGFASKEDIDAGMVNGANYPMGPLALSDLIGNDTMLFVAESLFEEFRQPRFAPPPVLKRMVEAGLLGRKSGRGFYDYA
jgi:3-hydroxybutyryl-CoA dehydrogenase